jgi:hypothetical protein
MSETADVTVAKRIVAELVRVGLLKPERAERFANDLGTGKVKNEDWKLLADPPHQPPTGGHDAE